MIQGIADFFDSTRFMPHGYCLTWRPDLLWLHVASDAVIVAAYFCIPFALMYFVHKRKDLPFQNVFLLFGAFILLCGMTHFMSIWVLWRPDYAAEGLIKAATAITSVATFFAVVRLIPKALLLPAPAQMSAINAQLQESNLRLEQLYTQTRESSESRLRTVVDNILDALITIDDRGTIQSFNPAGLRMFGYTEKEVIGQNVKMLMPEPYHSEHDGYLRNYHDTGTPKVIGIGREVTARRKDGSTFPVELGVNALPTDGRRMFVGTLRDITWRKAAELEKQNAGAELARINRELDSFVYLASHDLKSPLRAIDNLCRWMYDDLKDKLDETNRNRLDKLHGRVHRMENMLDDILAYSRAGGKLQSSASIDAAALVKELAEMLNPSEQFRIVADTSLAGILIPRMPLQQVLHNLIANAIKHHDKKKGTIAVSARDEGEFYRFLVTDDSPGIPRQYHAKVFEMFQTLKPRDEVEGSGMGLALVKKLITRFGGTIAIESEEGKGATFSFSWPKHLQTIKGEAA